MVQVMVGCLLLRQVLPPGINRHIAWNGKHQAIPQRVSLPTDSFGFGQPFQRPGRRKQKNSKAGEAVFGF